MNTEYDHRAAETAGALLLAWQTLKTQQNLSGNQAAALLGKSPAWFSIHGPRWRREGIAAFLPERRELGAQRRLFTGLPAWFLPVAKFYYISSNLTRTRGSVPEAIRRTIALPHCPPAVQGRLLKIISDTGWKASNGEKLPSCPPDLRETVLARAKAGQPMLPASLARQIAVAAPFVKAFRSPTDASLDYINGQGTQMWLTDSQTGEKQFIRGGDVVEADDATVNFPVCVPWPTRGCPCSERYEVKVARFQWLVSIDVGSRKVLGFTYTARPRSSYRGEDILSMVKAICQQHGVPRAFRFERGVWQSKIVTNAVDLLGSRRMSVHSPHSKPFVEGLFNQLWTKLSLWFPFSSVGRFRAENEEACKLLTACQAGHQDPRKYFPMLSDALAAFEDVIAEHNAHSIDSANYGRWVPNERWAADVATRPLAPINPETQWLFSPEVRDWKVKGNTVGGKVPLFPGCSVPYQFSAAKLLEYHGALTRSYFDPTEPKCNATICLAEPWGNHRQGEVICVAPQTNENTAQIRAMIGYGDGQSDGLAELRAAHAALRREVRAVAGPCPNPPVSSSEERDGLGNLAKITSGPSLRPAAIVPEPLPATVRTMTPRTGKVALLPSKIRDEVNERLHAGQIGPKIITWLNGLEEVKAIMAAEFRGKPVSVQNLSEWRKGGFKEWLSAMTCHDVKSSQAGSFSKRL
jgi:hypothetical protein